MRRLHTQEGFTLLEVMLALSILFAALVMLIDRTAHDVHLTERSEKLSIATDLTRGLIYDLEEELLRDGFQETDQEEDGDFSDLGWREFTWKAKIEKIELPALAGLEAMSGEDGAEGAEDAEGATESALSESPLAALLAMGGGDASSAAGAGFIASQFELIKSVLENAIRKVTVTIEWKVGDREEELTTTAYFTDPSAVQRTLGGLGGGGGGGGGGGDGDGDGDGDDGPPLRGGQ